MPAATRWRIRASIREPCRPISATARSIRPRVTPRWRQAGSKTSGAGCRGSVGRLDDRQAGHNAICIRQGRTKRCDFNRRRNVPSGSSSRNRRNHRSRASRSRRNGRRHNGSHRNRAKRASRRAAASRFPCRKRRTSTSSRRRFLRHRGRFHDAVWRSATVHPPPRCWSTRMRRPPATTTCRRRRRFLTRVTLSPDACASKLASLAT